MRATILDYNVGIIFCALSLKSKMAAHNGLPLFLDKYYQFQSHEKALYINKHGLQHSKWQIMPAMHVFLAFDSPKTWKFSALNIFFADTDHRCEGVAPIFWSDQSPNLQGYPYYYTYM